MKLQDKPTADEMADMIYYDNLKLLSGSVELAKDLSFYECKSNGTIFGVENIEYWREIAKIIKNKDFKPKQIELEL